MTRRPPGGTHLRSSAASLFGTLLRRTREDRGMSQGELARLIPCSRPLVTRVETGLRVPQRTFVLACDTHLDTGGELMEIWEEVDWYAQVEHPDWFQRYARIEATAATIREFISPWISGLLQTEAYARALFAHGDASDDPLIIEERVAARLARQHRLTGADAPLLVVILGEAALRQTVGGPQVMYEQFRHLLRMSRLPNVVVQVAPFSLGERLRFNTAITLITSPDGKTRVYSESLTHGRFIEDPKEVQRWQRAYDLLRADALSARDSALLIHGLMEGLLNMGTNTPDLSNASWRKASYSGNDGGQCIEVADGYRTLVPVRDSKDPEGPALVFSSAAWQAFVTAVRAGGLPTP